MTANLGIDISKRYFDVVLLVGEAKWSARFENGPEGCSALLAWLHQQQCERVHACLEATGRYGLRVAMALFEAGHRVSVVNPAQIKAFGQTVQARSKTDVLDAALLARFCQMYQPRTWVPPDPARERLRQLTRYQQGLEQQRQQECNRLQAGAVEPRVVQFIQAHVAYLDSLLAQVADEITAHLHAHAQLEHDCGLLDSIPGIGVKTATILVAELPDIRAFERAGQLVAYAGVDPRQHTSGSSVHQRTHISKRGNARLRRALFFPAISAKTHSRYFRPFVERLQASQHCPQSIVMAVMRKLLHLVFGILKQQQPFDPDYLALRAVAT